MKYSSVVVMSAFLLSILFMLSCRETPTTVELDFSNPMIKPMVTYTYPPANSIGPYDENRWDDGGKYEVRFNKLMDIESLSGAITISSPRYCSDTSQTWMYRERERCIIYPRDSSGHNIRFSDGMLYDQFTIHVARTARDINGNFLEHDFKATFIPEPYFRVRSIFPENGILGYQSKRVWVKLNSQIRKEMLSKFIWEPPVAGTWGRLDSDSSYVEFYFAGQIPDSFTLRVSDDLVDIHGNRLGRPFTKGFTLVPFQIYPGRSYNELSGDIHFYCNQPIDSTTIQSSFHISPGVPGSLSLNSDGDRVIFQPSHDLTQLARYEVTIDTTIRSIFGKSIGSPITYTFRTDAFTIDYANPRQGEVSVARESWIRCGFNDRLDTTTFEDAFNISPEVQGTFVTWSENDLNFVPHDSLAPLTVYTVNISSALKTKGGTNLMLPVTVSFMTGK